MSLEFECSPLAVDTDRDLDEWWAKYPGTEQNKQYDNLQVAACTFVCRTVAPPASRTNGNATIQKLPHNSDCECNSGKIEVALAERKHHGNCHGWPCWRSQALPRIFFRYPPSHPMYLMCISGWLDTALIWSGEFLNGRVINGSGEGLSFISTLQVPLVYHRLARGLEAHLLYSSFG